MYMYIDCACDSYLSIRIEFIVSRSIGNLFCIESYTIELYIHIYTLYMYIIRKINFVEFCK